MTRSSAPSVTDLPAATGAGRDLVVAEAAGRQHASRRRPIPLGMVSACAYSGAYPTGYGRYGIATEGVPPRRSTTGQLAVGVHALPAVRAPGAIRKYYNYFRVTPMIEPLDDLGRTLGRSPTRAPSPATTPRRSSRASAARSRSGPKSAVHRYTFPAATATRASSSTSRSAGWPSRTARPCRCGPTSRAIGPGVRAGRDRRRGRAARGARRVRRPASGARCSGTTGGCMPGGTRLDFDHIRPTTLRPFGLMWAGPTEPGQVRRAADRVLAARRRAGPRATSTRRLRAGPRRLRPRRRDRTRRAWRTHLAGRSASTRRRPSAGPCSRRALYHSLIKPCFAAGREPVLADRRARSSFDIATMWDIYRTQLPLLTALLPDRAVELRERAAAHLRGGGQLPDRLPDGARRRPVLPPGQRPRPHVPRRPAASSALPGIDWEWALVHMHNDLRRTYGEEFLLRGVAHPISHTLDLAFGYWCTAQVARARRRPPRSPSEFDDARRALGQRVRRRHRPAAGLDLLRGRPLELLVPAAARHGRPASSSPAATTRSWRMLDRVLRVRRRPGRPARACRPAVEEMRRRLRAQPLRGPQQRARHGGALGLPLRRAPRPHRRGRARRSCTTSSAPAAAGCPATTTPAGSAPGTCGRRSGCSRSPARTCSSSTRPRSPEPTSASAATTSSSPPPATSRPASATDAAGHRPQYVQSARFNGKPLDRAWHHRQPNCTAAGDSDRTRPRTVRLGTKTRPPSAVPNAPTPHGGGARLQELPP